MLTSKFCIIECISRTKKLFTSPCLYGIVDTPSNWLDSSHATVFFCARIRSIFRSRDIFINIRREITKVGNTVHSRESYNAFCIFLFLFFILFDTSPYRCSAGELMRKCDVIITRLLRVAYCTAEGKRQA